MVFRAASIAVLILSLNFLWGIGWVNDLLMAVIVLWLSASVWGMTSMRSPVFGRVYWRGDPASGKVALTFDDGPWPGGTDRVLDVLKEKGVRATFFVIGSNLSKYPELAARISNEGHEFGNHTQTHPWMFRMRHSSIIEDIEDCQAEIEKVAGYRPKFFRQPVGINNPGVMKSLDELGMVMVGWQVRAYDATNPKAERTVRLIMRGAGPGGIIILHDGCDGRLACSRDETVRALPSIIDGLQARGYEFVTVSELLGMENRQGAGKKAVI